ncbi:MAG: BrnT family toxin [Chloroflexi bacterium]|nr:BrnT family toxin [Chloroflexota bacterium]
MKISQVKWDEINVEHIARHGITPQEVEDVCSGPHQAFRGREKRHILFGTSSAGRYLKVILQRLEKSVYRPITAMEMTEAERRAFKKR